MKNPHKALQAIERLVGGDFGMDMECRLAGGEIKDRDFKLAAEIIGKIYVIAHAEGGCTGHPEWEDLKYEILKQPEE